MPVWLQIATAISTIVFGSVAVGILAWVKFFRTEAPLSDAQVREIEANVKVKEAQAAETVGTVLQNALSTVSDLAERRRLEITALEVRVDGHEELIHELKDDQRDRTHYYSPRGSHGQWDLDRVTEAAADGRPIPPPPPYPPTEEPR